jgi:ATP-dependent Clp protease protease subunit
MEQAPVATQQNAFDIREMFNQVAEASLFSTRQVMISEAITSAVAKRVISQLLAMEADKPGTPITIYQNSPGGEVNSGFAIYDTIRFLSSPVRIVNTGLCASIATIINIAIDKKHRYSMPNCKFLIHQPLISGQIYGQASDLEITARDILKTRQKLNELLAKECGQPLEKVEKDTKRDFWMTASEALEYGLITKIIENIKEVK